MRAADSAAGGREMRTLAVDSSMGRAEEIAEEIRRADAAGSHEAVCDLSEALKRITDNHYDMIWLGEELPGGNGTYIEDEIRRSAPGTGMMRIGLCKSGALTADHPASGGTGDSSGGAETAGTDKEHSVRIQCFGNFEAFVNGRRLRFSRSLGKEAMAYLVDRRGAGCTVPEICSVLWKDRTVDTNLKSQCRVILASLRKDLCAAGAGHIIVKTWNTWSIDTDAVTCDYYDLLRGDAATGVFRGEYMAQYKWAELKTVSA